MDQTSLLFVGMNVLFGALFVICARAVLGRRGSPILWAYVAVTLPFVYLLPVQEYSFDVGTEVLLLSHLLFLAYLLTVLLAARAHLGRIDELAWRVGAVPDGVIAAVIVGWLAVRAYLIVSYGPAALMFSRAQVYQSSGLVEFSTWDVALSGITTIALMGVFAVVVIRHAAGGRGPSVFVMMVTMAMVALVVVTNESPIGSRRLLLALGALWFSVALMSSGMSLPAWVGRHGVRLALVAAVVAVLAVYYQNVRNNDFTQILSATRPGDLVAATVRFATTLAPEQDREEVQHLRSGPLDFFAKVVDVWVMDGRSADGSATALSFAIAVPKALYPGEKPAGDVDEVLLERLDIYPSKPFLSIDYPTSLPAIGVADFGPAGVLLAGFVLGLAWVVVGFLIRAFGRNPLALLIVLGSAVQLIGSQEAALSSILSTLRDAGIALLAILPIGWLWLRISRHIRALRASRIQIGVAASDRVPGIGGAS